MHLKIDNSNLSSYEGFFFLTVHGEMVRVSPLKQWWTSWFCYLGWNLLRLQCKLMRYLCTEQ